MTSRFVGLPLDLQVLEADSCTEGMTVCPWFEGSYHFAAVTLVFSTGRSVPPGHALSHDGWPASESRHNVSVSSFIRPWLSCTPLFTGSRPRGFRNPAVFVVVGWRNSVLDLGTVVAATGARVLAVWNGSRVVRSASWPSTDARCCRTLAAYRLALSGDGLRSCCSSSRVAPDRASASVTNAPTAGARCMVMACHSASVGSGTMFPRRKASVNLVRLHPPSGPLVAASRSLHRLRAFLVRDWVRCP